ncbi:ABC transporter permease [Solwaraspora sp. WMMD1047]|uniref:ABC transporter permease n=1 Tax=Solwaraspora sp. WMMD1047 TaxID=3016102 RepID=UPI0024178E42|nr:ABC transporter permease [Solwaraspora sp. WMMD1047]MDG4834294.1 ABC transporter permease [Solwaraspora sp. WMMD1047]
MSAPTTTGPAPAAPTPRRRFLRRFLRHRPGVVAAALLLVIVLVAIAAPLLAPDDPLAQNLDGVLLPPDADHLLGTDDLGRDVLSRLLYGTRISLLAALQGTGIAILLGVPAGLLAGYFGGWLDRVIMTVTDAVMAFPALVLAVALAGVLGPSLTNAMLAVGVVMAPRALRLVRAAVLEVREETYTEASRSIGSSVTRILRRHVLPNIAPPLVVFTAITAGHVMLVEAGMSFIGVGVQPPDASWGAMLGGGFRFITRAPTLIIFPGLAIALAVFAFTLLGDGIRDSIGREERR